MLVRDIIKEDEYDKLNKVIDKLEKQYLKNLQKIAMDMFDLEWNKIKNLNYDELNTLLRKINK